ncbi:serine/threonine-protein kinase BSK7-like isoform X2 [Apium graveolens]|uniref:serine/threonine-protein kinase BSK7-like isoform X2 n=1 Tax=Apium graveolens TaxID=4045 RepID=UPI003D7BCA1B
MYQKQMVSSQELMGIPDSTGAFPLSPLVDACLRNDLTAIHEILEKLGYKDDKGAATELIMLVERDESAGEVCKTNASHGNGELTE